MAESTRKEMDKLSKVVRLGSFGFVRFAHPSHADDTKEGVLASVAAKDMPLTPNQRRNGVSKNGKSVGTIIVRRSVIIDGAKDVLDDERVHDVLVKYAGQITPATAPGVSIVGPRGGDMVVDARPGLDLWSIWSEARTVLACLPHRRYANTRQVKFIGSRKDDDSTRHIAFVLDKNGKESLLKDAAAFFGHYGLALPNETVEQHVSIAKTNSLTVAHAMVNNLRDLQLGPMPIAFGQAIPHINQA